MLSKSQESELLSAKGYIETKEAGEYKSPSDERIETYYPDHSRFFDPKGLVHIEGVDFSKTYIHPKACWVWTLPYLNNDTVNANTIIVEVGGAMADGLPHIHCSNKYNVDHLVDEYKKIYPEMDEAGTKHMQGMAEDLPFSDGLADYVYCRNALDHVDNHVKALLEIHRVLKDDGILLLGVYYNNSNFMDIKEPIVIDDEFMRRCIKPLFDVISNVHDPFTRSFQHIVCKKKSEGNLSFTTEEIESVGTMLKLFREGKYDELLNMEPIFGVDKKRINSVR